MLGPEFLTGLVKNRHEFADVFGLETSGKISRRGGVGDPLGSESLAQALAALQKKNQIRTATLWCLESLLAAIRAEETAQVCSHRKKGDHVLVGRIESSSLPNPVRPP